MVFSGFPKVQPPLFFRSRALRGRPAAPPASERPAAAAPIPMHCGARSSQRYRSWVPAEPAEATHRLHEGRPKTSRKYMEIYGNTIHVARILSWDLFIFFQSSSLQKARISLKNKCLKYGGCFDKRRRVLNKCSQVSNNPWKKSKKCSLSSQSFFWNVIHFPAAFDKPILHDVQPSKPEQSTFQNVRQFFWEKHIHAQYAMVFIRHIVFWNECCLPFYINVGHPSWKRSTYCWTNCSLLQHYLFSWAGAVLHPKRPALLLKLEKTSLSNFYKKFNL